MSEELNNQSQETEEVNAAENLENTTETTTETQETTDVNYTQVETVEKATEVLESKGFDYDSLTEEFQANGDLLPETRQKLEAQGIPAHMVDSYIEGQKAIVQRTMEDIASTVGGMENMASIVDWAKANLSEAEKKSIDAVHDPAVIKILLKDLERRMKDNEGYVPQQTLQGGAGEVQGNYFESMAEVEEAINDPRYSKDPVYRDKVAKKLTASREAGILEIK